MKKFLTVLLALTLIAPFAPAAFADANAPQIDRNDVVHQWWLPIALEVGEFVIEHQWEPVFALLNGEVTVDDMLSRLPVVNESETLQRQITYADTASADDTTFDAEALYERIMNAMR